MITWTRGVVIACSIQMGKLHILALKVVFWLSNNCDQGGKPLIIVGRTIERGRLFSETEYVITETLVIERAQIN